MTPHARTLRQLDGGLPIPDRGHDAVKQDLRNYLFQQFDPPVEEHASHDPTSQDPAHTAGFTPEIQSAAHREGVDRDALYAFLEDTVELLNGTGFDADGTPIIFHVGTMVADKYLGDRTPGWCGVVTDVQTDADGTPTAVNIQELQTVSNYRKPVVQNTTRPARAGRPEAPPTDEETWLKPFLLDNSWWKAPHYPDHALRLAPTETTDDVTVDRGPPQESDITLHTPSIGRYTIRFLTDAPDDAAGAFDSFPDTQLPAALAIPHDDQDGDWRVANHQLSEMIQHLLDAGWTVTLSQVVETRFFTPDALGIEPPSAPWQPDTP